MEGAKEGLSVSTLSARRGARTLETRETLPCTIPWVRLVLAVCLLVGSAAALLTGGCGVAGGPSFPAREIALIVGWAPGSTTDLQARAHATATEPHMGVPIVIKNVVGASGATGLAEAARAKPDGYTVHVFMESGSVLAPLMQEAPASLDDFDLIMQVWVNPIFWVVRPDSPYKSVDDIIADAKAKGGHNYGFSSIATSGALAMAALAKQTGVNLKLVPFNSAAEGVTAAMGGHVDSALGHPGDVIAHVREGRMRAIAGFGEYKGMDKLLPGVKSLRQLGYNYEAAGLAAVGVPKGTPKDIAKTLHDAFKKGLEDKEFVDTMDKRMSLIAYQPGEETKQIWVKDREFYTKVLGDLGLLKK